MFFYFFASPGRLAKKYFFTLLQVLGGCTARCARQDADDTVKGLKEAHRYIDLHMNVLKEARFARLHTHGGFAPPPPPCVWIPLYFIHISMYFSSLYKLFSLKSAPGGSLKKSDEMGGSGAAPPGI